MTVAAGSRIGPYEIVAPLGAGGMGEVWRARDPRLGRDVAIKALPESLAHDPERVARFEREARLLASLNHPGIGGIYGLEEAGGHRYLILEFIEGQTLADRLRRGALSIPETLAIGRAIAAALEAAHESGVIHRDLKPGNVMLRADGEVKVLDFGLAKGGTNAASGDAGLSASPTITYAGTSAGVVLGTAAYMSPEQARGKAVDRRTDIWSFGCVLYECLTGRQAFAGETVSDVIARILEREPDWSALPPATSPALRDLLQRCLDKDAKQRLRDIGDARLVLDRERAGGQSSAVVGAAPAGRDRGAAWTRYVLPVAAGLLVVALGMTVARTARGPRLPRNATHLSIAVPDDPKILNGEWSRDGSSLLFIGLPLAEETKGATAFRLYVRRLDDFDLHELPGTIGVVLARYAPDGRNLIFRGPLAPGAREERLARVPVDGSAPPVTIVPWNRDWSSFAVLHSGEIVAIDAQGRRLFHISPHDGSVKEVAIARGDVHGTMTLQRPLPDDRGVFVNAGVYRENGWALETGVIDLEHARLVLPGIRGGNALLLPSGTLLFSLGQVLLAAPFDAEKFVLRAAPIAVETGLTSTFSYTPGGFTVTDDGALSYVPGGEAGNGRRLGVVDAAGKLTMLPADPQPYQGWPSPSRDGRTFGIRVTSAQGLDEIWIGDRERANLRRLVSWPKADCSSLYLSPDGRTAAYARVGRDAEDGIYFADVDGSGPGRRVLAPESSSVVLRNDAWSPDGKWLIVARKVGSAPGDLCVASVAAKRDSLGPLRLLRQANGEENSSDFSPDGRRIAFQSDESGRVEIYVAPFSPDGTLGRPERITEQGGTVPEWLPDGRHLAFRDLFNRHEMIVDVDATTADARTPREWFDYDALKIQDSAVSHDGNAIVVVQGPNEGRLRSVNFVFGWIDELKKKLAAAR